MKLHNLEISYLKETFIYARTIQFKDIRIDLRSLMYLKEYCHVLA